MKKFFRALFIGGCSGLLPLISISLEPSLAYVPAGIVLLAMLAAVGSVIGVLLITDTPRD